MRRALVTTWGIGTAFWLAPASAIPCTCLFACYNFDPAPGATDVPLNQRPRIVFRPETCLVAVGVSQLRFLDADGTPVAGSWVEVVPDSGGTRAFEFRAAADLASGTTYTFGHAEADSLAPFTTGDARDETPPAFAGATGIRCEHDTCGSQACCGPFNGWGVTLEHERPGDARGLHVYLRSSTGTYDFDVPAGSASFRTYSTLCNPGSCWSLPSGPPPYYAVLRAYDAAGNEDDNVVEVKVSCPFDIRDCADGADAAPGAAAGGCSCAIGARP